MVQGDDQHTTLVLSAAGGGKGSAGAGKSRAAGGGQPKQPKPAKPEGAPVAVGRGRSARPRIGVISDTHGYLDPAVVKLFGGVTHIIHAGDVMDPEILERLARIEAKQDAHIAAYATDKVGSDGRITKLEHTVNGNGQVGLAEEMRNIKTRISWIVGGITLAANAAFQLALKWGGK